MPYKTIGEFLVNIPIDTILWAITMIIFIVAEASTAALVCIWFVFGAIAALIASSLGASIPVQITLFLIVSIAALILTKPLVKKRLEGRIVSTNADRVLSQSGTVIEAIDNIAGTGRVKVSGIEWAARSEDGEVIPAGVIVSPVRIEGVKLFVRLAVEPALTK